LTWAPTIDAASAGSDENERVPITGLSGLTLVSATGAKLVLTPIARSSSPVMAAAVRASSVLRPAPSAIEPGNWVAGGPMRVTTPCSWSIAIWSGTSTFESCDSAAFWRPFESPVIWSGFLTLSVHAK
jgi:hypothetical protein